jgi:predicted MPP superfamily phosphohydrolase
LKIAHIADTHIRNYKYHKEYRVIFDQIFDRLREEQVDLIVHCGDLAHTNFDLATHFLKNLADIAPTYIILGNHDGNLKNEHRQDAITPIANALAHNNLHLLKNAGEVVVGDVALNVLSVFDEDNWVKPSDPSRRRQLGEAIRSIPHQHCSLPRLCFGCEDGHGLGDGSRRPSHQHL